MQENKIFDNVSDKLNEVTEQVNTVTSAAVLQLETMTELWKDERMETNKLHTEEIEKMQERFHNETESIRKHYFKIILGLVIALIILLSGVFGTIAYVLSNYEISTCAIQEVDGQSVIYDGIHY